jgi:hypothetical protein
VTEFTLVTVNTKLFVDVPFNEVPLNVSVSLIAYPVPPLSNLTRYLDPFLVISNVAPVPDPEVESALVF